jgi:RNA polymerase sigma-70 factor (ECF subfamily)
VEEPANLVASALRGDASAFAALHARFERLVHAILLTRAPVAEVEDLVQETFLRAWQQLAHLRDPASFGSWIVMIARNLAADHLRHRPRLTQLSDHHSRCNAVDPVAFEVLDQIRALPEAYGETLLMRLVEGLTGPEIAEQTGLTPDSVRVNLHRGMKLLRNKLAGNSLP